MRMKQIPKQVAKLIAKPIAVMAMLVISSGSMAAVNEQQFQQLLEQMNKMNSRLDKLEQENASLKQTNSELRQTNTVAIEQSSQMEEKLTGVDQRVEAVSWAERIRWKGDFRPRYEYIDAEGRETRNRNRIRARAEIIAEISPQLIVGIGLASGSESPVSTNQTLGAGGTTKNLSMDLAYFDWQATDKLAVGAGKFKNPINRTGGHALMMDSDWRPEGINMRWENSKLFVNSMFNYFEGDSNRGTKPSYFVQAGINLQPTDALRLKIGGGYSVMAASGNSSFFGDDDFFGNSFNPLTLRYRYDYNVFQGFAELGFSLFELPVLIFADIIHNSEAPINNDGYAVGFRLGKINKPGEWDVRLAYQDLEADSTFGLITDSDFGGGGTDVRGYIFRGGYGIVKNWSANMTYIHSQNSLAAGDIKDFRRLHLDLNFKFK
ncbi:MAG: putative porin [Xanthomonadales bacterium]|nr:putative porin [Xanthomonadales bacterium]